MKRRVIKNNGGSSYDGLNINSLRRG